MSLEWFNFKIKSKNFEYKMQVKNKEYGALNKFGFKLFDFLKIFTSDEISIALKDKELISSDKQIHKYRFQLIEESMNKYNLEKSLLELEDENTQYLKSKKLQIKMLNEPMFLLDENIPFIQDRYLKNEDFEFEYILDLDNDKLVIKQETEAYKKYLEEKEDNISDFYNQMSIVSERLSNFKNNTNHSFLKDLQNKKMLEGIKELQDKVVSINKIVIQLKDIQDLNLDFNRDILPAFEI